MNDFDAILKKAKSKQRRVYGILAVSLAAVVMILTGVIFFTNGTSVITHPDDAASTRKLSVIDGIGLAIGDAVYAMTDEPVIRVSAIGFKPEERKITIQEKGRSIEVTLWPLPGKLIATTSPENPNTRWSINAQATAIAPNLGLQLEAGDYTLDINNPHYEPATRKFTINRAEEIQIHVELTHIQGKLHLSAIPEDARISINGGPGELLPLETTREGGLYHIEVSHPDYLTAAETIEITNTELDISRSYRLVRKPSALNFSLTPLGGHLLVDGATVDPTTPLSVTSNVEHKITYMKDGYFSESRSQTLLPAESRHIAFNLNPEIGTVEVQSIPEATVFVNGKESGQTPLTLKLPALSYKISIQKPGYRSFEQTVKPNGKNPILVQTTLQTELSARLASAPKEYVNTVGISLKLFHPSDFTMGAPRQELGQRANEFVRTINLKRPFYSGLHEITKDQYNQYMGNAAAQGAGNTPVTSIRWEDAALYCNWLSQKEGLNPFYNMQGNTLISVNRTADGFRLLSEAEWEWLARRAGRKHQSIFPWGDDAVVPPMTGNISDESANGQSDFFVPNYNDGYAEVAPVGSFQGEPSGLFDLVGNVSEWVHDFYSLLPSDPKKVEVDPLGSKSGDSHVVKGSNWRSGTRTELRAAYREGLTDGRDDVGFRVGRYLYGGVDDAKIQ